MVDKVTDSAPNRPFIITIDGPSGSGKGTIATRVAASLGFHRLDSGALYRVLALHCMQQQIDIEADGCEHFYELAENLPVVFESLENQEVILLGEQDVSRAVRTEEVGNAASILAAKPSVRKGLLARQHTFLKPPGLVADGRDMGTVVFPDADLKIFLDASDAERARRRAKQLSLQQESDKIDGLLRTIQERDERDRQRSIAPLQPADEAVYIDSTNLTIDTIVDNVQQLVKRLRS